MKIYFYWYNVNNMQEELLVETDETIPSISVRDDGERGIPGVITKVVYKRISTE